MEKEKTFGLDMEACCKRVAKLIGDSGLNDKEIAKTLNLSVQSVNKWRHGHAFPDIENLYNISVILGTTVDDLLVPKN